MAKLHELLAVEGDLQGAYKRILAETANTLNNKVDHFQEWTKTYTPLDEDDLDVVPEERKEMVTTVRDKIEYMMKEHVIPYFDAVLQKERTNQDARADIVVDGKTIATDVPATFLLGLEEKLKRLREVFDKIPTLPPGIEWKPDPDRGDNVYKMSYPEVTRRTRKVTKPVVLYEATDKHPAQVKEVSEDIPVGKFTKVAWSGMMSPAEKSRLLARVDRLSRAVKQARQRANTTEVVDTHISILSDFILSDKEDDDA